MDGATTASTGSNNSTPGGTNSNGGANGFLNLGNLGSSSTATVGGMGLFSTGGGGDALGGFGASLGNGFANDGASIGAGGGAGGSANPSFDISDFPSLGGGAAGGVGAAGNAAGNADLAAALRQQQQQLQQQLMQRGVSEADKSSNLYRLAMSSGIAQGAGNNFSMATEDFPALGGGAGGEGKDGGLGSAPTGGSILDPSGGNQLDYTGLIGSTGGATSSSVQQTRTTTTAGSGASSTAGGSTNAGSGGAIGGDYGLLGLLSVIRMTDADRNRLALGSDLTVLGGLNLNSPESIHSTFGGPFSIKPSTKEPHYQLPMCYYMQPPALKTGHLSKFQLETLFYIFYALPKDVLQAYAAQELYTREWRYHAESRLWFKEATPTEITAVNASASGGQYTHIYFDITAWERRVYGNVNNNINITEGFLSEEDITVKFPSS